MRINLTTGTPAELARPSSGSPGMGLVVLPDIFGLRPLFDDLCQRLADEWTMAVCAVDPFPGRDDLPAEPDRRWEAVGERDDLGRFADFEAAADATGCERTGVIGFCIGGMYALKAGSLDRFARAVAFYGMIRIPPAGVGPGQGEPLDLLADGHPDRVLAILGERDPYTPPGDIAALEALGVTTARYPAAEHGFVHDPARPAHRPDDAADAWRRCEAWLRS
jgi:carboxymethylenebutenolidase